ncbi:MAG: hypothetical protein QXL11_03465, partial [Zestosphaera sp.]
MDSIFPSLLHRVGVGGEAPRPSAGLNPTPTGNVALNFPITLALQKGEEVSYVITLQGLRHLLTLASFIF